MQNSGTQHLWKRGSGVSIGLLLLGILASIQPSAAADYSTRYMTYKNRGSYVATFGVRWETATGQNCRAHGPDSKASNGETVVLDLKVDYGSLRWDVGSENVCPLNEGDEVWGVFEISFGEHKSCRKSEKMLYSEKGGMVKYSSAGTTLNNNRCQVDEKPDEVWGKPLKPQPR
jgi:hypothetical protein